MTLQSVALQLKRHNLHPLCFKIHAVLLCIDYLLNIAAFRSLKEFFYLFTLCEHKQKNALLQDYSFFLLGKAKHLEFQPSGSMLC